MQKKRFWTEPEVEILIAMYPDEWNKDIAIKLGRNIDSVVHKAVVLGLKKSEAFFKSDKSGRNHLAKVGNGTRFKKGQISHNKGLKQSEFMSADKIEKTKATRFKNGLVPHNRVPIGTERFGKDGFIQIKVADGKLNRNWEQKNRWVWEQNNGPIPKGCVVEFIDEDKTNFELSNLRMVTRKENILKNTLRDESILKRFLKIKNEDDIKDFIEKYPHVIELKRQQLILNQIINKNEPTKTKRAK